MTRSMLLVLVTFLLAGVAAGQDFADYYYLPPETPEGEGTAEGETLAAKSGLAENVLSAALQHTHPVYAFRGFEGQKSALDIEGQDYPAFRVAAEYPVELSGDTLFDDGVVKGGERYFVAEIVSSEAYAIRLCADLSSLTPADEVWMVSPAVERAFGPYTSRDAPEGRLWLPTVSGDTALLVVRQAQRARRPGLRIESLAHFYVDMTKAVYPCPIDAACE